PTPSPPSTGLASIRSTSAAGRVSSLTWAASPPAPPCRRRCAPRVSFEGRIYDRHPPLRLAGPRRPRLAQRAAPFLLRQLPRAGPHGLGRIARVERRRDRPPLWLPAPPA